MSEQITATYIDSMGSDLSVVNAARVSFGKKSEFTKECHNCGEHTVSKYGFIDLWECGSCHIDIDQVNRKISDSDTKLINYLAKHKHISPFGHAFASFHVKAPIFVARQLVKHKFLRWNEISRRYVDDEPEFYTPDVWRGRSADKKQGSEGVAQTFVSDWDTYNHSLKIYKDLLKDGVAPEQARMVLPQSTMTEWYWSGSLDAFASMCRLRLPSDTQQETRVVAQQISKVLGTLFPVSWAALMSNP
jgi:thymidylate synthase (FAD)